LDVVTRVDFARELNERALELGTALRELASRHAATLRGRGFLWAIELPAPTAAKVRDACFEAGLLVNAARPNAVRLMPSLRTSSAEIEQACRILDTAMTQAGR
jgi:acetylornithine/N-succinyldiaminopimelate aminotransferase